MLIKLFDVAVRFESGFFVNQAKDLRNCSINFVFLRNEKENNLIYGDDIPCFDGKHVMY